MSIAVVDSTVLIYLARLGDLGLLETQFDQVLIPEAVYEEVVSEGRAGGYEDALTIEERVNDGFDRVSLSDGDEDADRLQTTANLGRGEVEAIALARLRSARCLTDDGAARTTAESLGVDVGGTIFVLLDALASGRLGREEYTARIDELSESGFRMSATLYRRAIDAGEDIAEGE